MKSLQLLSISCILIFTTCKKGQEVAAPVEKIPSKDYMEYSNQGLVGSGGGKIQITDPSSTIKNAYIDISQGTLSQTTNFSLSKPTKKYYFEGDSTQLLVSLEPSGIQFEKPITIGIPYNPNYDPDNLQVYFYDEVNFTWKQVLKISVDRSKNLIIAQTTHFSVYTAVATALQFDIDLFKKGNLVSGKVWLLNPFSTFKLFGSDRLYGTSIEDVILNSDWTIGVGYVVQLKEKANFRWNWFDQTIATKRILYSSNAAWDEANKFLWSDGQPFGGFKKDRLIYFSGKPLLFQFPGINLDTSKKYYLDVTMYFLKNIYWTEPLEFFGNSRGYNVSSYVGAKLPSQMQTPSDADGDGIVDEYDPTNGNPPNTPSNPNPSNAATGISISPTLSWDCTDPDNDPLTYDVYFGTSSNPTTKVSPNQTTKSYTPSTLTAGVDYYWKVVATDNHSNSTPGPVWKFTTIPPVNQPPTQPATPSPTNNATSISTSPTLSWTCSDLENDPLTYDIYLGTASNPTSKVSADQTSKSYSASNLTAGTDYYWKVVAKDNKNNSTPSQVWKFTTIAANSIVDLSIANFTLTPLQPTEKDEITFAVSVNNIGSDPSPASKLSLSIAGETNPAIYDIPALTKDQNFSINRKTTLSKGSYRATAKIDPSNVINEIDKTNNTKILDFEVIASINQPPTQPSAPSPSNNATAISLTPTLSWTCTDPENDPLTFDVYFDISSNPTMLISPNQTAFNFSPGTLTAGRDYYWKVVAKDTKSNTTSSPVWKFTTTGTTPSGSVSDTDGNTYSTVTIGTQVWMASNLKTSKYNDGTAIPSVTDNTDWSNLSTPGYCWYNNDVAVNKSTYGALYNWYTVNTGKLCPTGWHVPTDQEWTSFTNFLGGESVAAGKLKETGTSHWLSPNTGATNETGFTAVPGGYRYHNGNFLNFGSYGSWWSATEASTSLAWYRDMYYNYSYVLRTNYDKVEGNSVRCLKDY